MKIELEQVFADSPLIGDLHERRAMDTGRSDSESALVDHHQGQVGDHEPFRVSDHSRGRMASMVRLDRITAAPEPIASIPLY